MEITENSSTGLKRAFTLTIPASRIEALIDGEVQKIAPQVRMPGFRPGKVPGNLVRKMHGEQLHAQAINEAVRSGVDTLLREKQLRPAMQPSVNLASDYAQGTDARVDVELEVLPQVTAPSTDGLKLERLTAPVTDEQVDEVLGRIAGQNTRFDDAPEGHAAENGDQVEIDFVGRIDGEEFEGGKAEGAPLTLGSGTFIPGFEDGLIGATSGETRTVPVTFPEDYQAAHLAGKAAEFEVTVRAVRRPGETQLDDAFAKSLGLEGIDKLRELVRGQIEQEHAGLTRTQMKRALLDQLAAGHDFEVPEGMVEAEFNQIWQQLEQEAQRSDDPEAARAELEAERDDYRRIAVRRVRLGLLLSEIGQANNVQISGQEMNALLQQAAQQYRPEDRQRFLEYVQSEPMAAAQLRAPLYEDKVVDFLFDKAEITDREVTRSELEAAIEAEEGATSGAAGEGQAAQSDNTVAAVTDKPAKAGSKKAKAAAPAAETPTAETLAGGDDAVLAEPAKTGATRKGGKKAAATSEAPAADTAPADAAPAADQAVAAEPAKKGASRKGSAKPKAG